MRGLEERLGLRLLNRTTRSVAPTEAGERLLRSIEPQFAQIEGSLLALTELRDKPSGIVRITSTQHAAETAALAATVETDARVSRHHDRTRD